MSRIEPLWQWFVLSGAVMVHVVAGGIMYSFGIIYTDIRDRLETPATQISLIAGIALACYCFVAPFTRALTSKLGSRLVTIMGALVASLGLALCAVAPTIHYYYVFFGMFVGGGYGMMTIASILIVKAYFPQHSGLPMTILACGWPIGIFVFPLIIRVMFDNFSHFGMFIISAGVMLNCIAFGLLFRPVAKITMRDPGTYEKMADPVSNDVIASHYTPTRHDISIADELQDAANGVQNNVDESKHSNDTHTENDALKPKTDKHYKAVEGPTESMLVSTLEKSWKFDDTVLYESDDNDDDVADEHRADVDDIKPESKPHVTSAIPEPNGAAVDTTDAPESFSNGTVPVTDSEDMPSVGQTLLAVVTGLSDAKEICNWRLLLYVLACVVYSVGWGVPLCVYPDLVKSYGYTDTQAVWTLPLVGLACCIGVVIIGAVRRATQNDAELLIAALCAIATGLIVGFIHFYTKLGLILLSCLLYGLFSTIFYFVKERILKEILDDVTNVGAYAVFSTWCSGYGFLIGLPIAGHLYEVNGDYRSSFIMITVCCGVAALLLTPLMVWKRLAHR